MNLLTFRPRLILLPCPQIIVPLLFVYFFDRAAAAWSQGQPADGSAAGEGGAGTGLAATWRARPAGGAAQQRRSDTNGAAPEAWLLPSAIVMLLFGLGVSGVLFDVFLTYSSRHPLA